MRTIDVLQLVLYLVVLLLLAWPLGNFMAAVYGGRRTFLLPVVGPLERLCYRLAGVDAASETGWVRYAAQMLVFNLVGLLVVYALQRMQELAAAEPAAASERVSPTRRSIPRSASSPTRTGRATAANRR